MDAQYRQFCKDMNEQLPLSIDEITTLFSCLYNNRTMIFSYRVNLDLDDFSKDDIAGMKEILYESNKQQMIRLLDFGDYSADRSEFREFMRQTGLKMQTMYFDCYNRLIFRLTFDYHDL